MLNATTPWAAAALAALPDLSAGRREYVRLQSLIAPSVPLPSLIDLETP